MTMIAYIHYPILIGLAALAGLVWAIGQLLAFVVAIIYFSFKGLRHLYYAAKVAYWRRGTKGL